MTSEPTPIGAGESSPAPDGSVIRYLGPQDSDAQRKACSGCTHFIDPLHVFPVPCDACSRRIRHDCHTPNAGGEH
jgi:hypothetical protein